MHPIPANSSIGAALATVFSRSGKSQAVQVCPGVFLATAHGVLDNPADAQADGRPLETPSSNLYGLVQFPLSRDGVLVAPSDSQFLSPRLADVSDWSRAATDYVFVSVEGPHSDQVIRPVRASASDLQHASERGDIDVHLLRPSSRFALDQQGLPRLGEGMRFNTLDEMAPLYRAPNWVNQRCEIEQGFEGLVGTHCPTEHSVSGSSYVTEISGQTFLTMIHGFGLPEIGATRDGMALPNASVQASHFCADYEQVCGTPCLELADLIEPTEAAASFFETRMARIEAACDNGWPTCQTSAYSLALEARHGTQNLPRDLPQALEVLQMAAENGSGPAHLDLALLHEAPVQNGATRAQEVWDGIGATRQYSLPDLEALFDLGPYIASDPQTAAGHHVAALEAGMDAMLSRDVEDWPEETATALQAHLANRNVYDGPVDGRIDLGTVSAMQALCRCE